MKFLLGIVAVIFSANIFAGTITTVEATKDLCGKAAEAFGKGDPKKSFQILKPFWPIASEELDNMAYQTASQISMITSQIGEILGSDYVGSKTAGDSFVQHTYIGKFEKHAVRYICVFYKPRTEWVVNGVYWDDKTRLLFD
jgi:hypothetical protein